jgi:hypothetical protein
MMGIDQNEFQQHLIAQYQRFHDQYKAQHLAKLARKELNCFD